jgi:hypothetical protein
MQALARIAAGLTVSLALMSSAQMRTPAQTGTPPQTRTPSGTLVIAGQQDQAPVIRVNGHPYVDVESLARITRATVRYVGNQIILTLPQSDQSMQAASSAQPASTTPQLSGAFLAAEIEALTAIREWRVSLSNAIQNNYPVADNWLAPLRRFADEKLQFAAAAASSDPEQKTLELLRNEFTNMQQLSDSFLAMRVRVNYIPTDSLDNNPQDQKVLACQRALAQVAASKQFQDDLSCH